MTGVAMDLNAEQKRIAFQTPKGHALLKGVAGSGKTTVGIYRVPFLLNSYCFGKDDAILLVTYTKTLIRYMAKLYEKVSSTEGKNFATLFGTPDRKVEIRTIDSMVYRSYQTYARRHGLKHEIGVKNAEALSIVSEGAEKLKKRFPDVNALDQRNTPFLFEEINWIKDCLFLEEEEYQNADRVGQARRSDGNRPQRLQKNSEARRAVFELMRFFDRRLNDAGRIDYATMRVLALEEVRENPPEAYTHIVVDESQDLTRAQLLFLKALYRPKDHSSILFIADTAQSIYTQSWLGNGRSFASIGFNMAGRSANLSKNYRTTTQISKAAYSLIDGCPEIVEDENFVKPQLIDRQGEFPVCRLFRNDRDQAAYLAGEIEALSEHHGYREMALVARTRRQLEDLNGVLGQHGIPCEVVGKEEVDFESERVKLITMHSIKGLEFPVVFLFGLNERVLPIHSIRDPEKRQEEEAQERRLLYVGMTRATESLYLTASDKPSKFLRDIDSRWLRMDSASRCRRFYNVAIGNYRFADRLQDVYAKEEKVRQWIIAELVESFGYPESAIRIEYPLNAFSRKGYVDIAVLISEEGAVRPLVFIETKQPDAALKDALSQLRSYMSHCPDCEYGVATNGRQLVVLDRNDNRVPDIPRFRNTWQVSQLCRQAVINLKTGARSCLCIDPNDPVFLEVEGAEGSEGYEKGTFAALPVYGRIAAGQPVEMNARLEDIVYLPAEWVRGASFFALKVEGDSMVNAGMENGDFVVIRQQAAADNLDIVVAAIGEEATLKKFSRMGSNVLLLAENPAYDPIMCEEAQVKIMGKATHLIKASAA